MGNKFKVRKSKIEGYGIYCSIPILKGELICKFQGEEITIGELKKRYEKGKERSTDPLQVKDTRYLDLVKPYVYFNHSCNPNTAVIHYGDLIALRDIKIGEEITYDYSATDWSCESYWIGYLDYWTMKCNCKFSKCRKIIREWSFMAKTWQKKYINERLVQDYILKKYKKNP